jgi:hypothetical protein
MRYVTFIITASIQFVYLDLSGLCIVAYTECSFHCIIYRMSVKFLYNLCGVEVTKNKFHVFCKGEAAIFVLYRNTDVS